MAAPKVVGKTIVISLALLCVLTVAMMPVASASYGDARRFIRPSPWGLGPAKLWNEYFAAVADPPGRICSIFLLGMLEDPPENHINYLDASEALVIGPVGFYVTAWWGFDHKSAREYYNNHGYRIWIDGVEVEVEKTPMRHCLFTDHITGDKWVWWEWRYGITYKEGELADLLGGLGTYTIRFQMLDDGGVYFDSDLIDTYYFELV